MRDKELPLVGFTVLSQLSVGLCLAAVPMVVTDMPHAGIRLLYLFGASLGALALAMLVSLAHLGRPQGSVRTLANLKTSWLSREIAAFGGFGLLVLLNLALIQTGGAPWPACILAAAVMGVAAVYASARIYATPSYPALDNALPFAFFLASALVLGPAFATPAGRASGPARVDRLALRGTGRRRHPSPGGAAVLAARLTQHAPDRQGYAARALFPPAHGRWIRPAPDRAGRIGQHAAVAARAFAGSGMRGPGFVFQPRGAYGGDDRTSRMTTRYVYAPPSHVTQGVRKEEIVGCAEPREAQQKR